ncbi:MAG: hypothetical protein JHC95_18270 [Solirubrobacteraceae bacterium]|nr:hypothetical protein [Solirubrobacteraceae bacterium]
MNDNRTLTRRRVVAAVAALAGIAAGVLLAGEDASAGRLVTGKQITDSSLTGKDLRDGTVTTRDITDGSLTPDDLRLPGVTSLRQTGPGGYEPQPGVAGPPGPQGPPGPRGPSGVFDLRRVTTSSVVASQTHGTVTTPCPGATKALSGGVLVDGPAAAVPINVSAPLDNGTGWQSMVRNGDSQSITVKGWVICATAY